MGSSFRCQKSTCSEEAKIEKLQKYQVNFSSCGTCTTKQIGSGVLGPNISINLEFVEFKQNFIFLIYS